MTAQIELGERALAALREFTDRCFKANTCFEAQDQPAWKRTTSAMLCFKGLPLDGLPTKVRRRIDSCFAQINKVSARYPIQTWEDYQKVSPEDLAQIRRLIQALL
jgi:hypothetical protein